MHKSVAGQHMNKPISWLGTVWNTHVDDYSNGWRASVKYFARSGARKRLAVAENFI